MNTLIEVERSYLRQDVPEFRAGDTVRVQVRVKEGDKERLQAFQGVVDRPQGQRHPRDVHGAQDLRRHRRRAHLPAARAGRRPHRGSCAAVEVRRAKLYYLRDLRGKAARIEERRDEDAASGARLSGSPRAASSRAGAVGSGDIGVTTTLELCCEALPARSDAGARRSPAAAPASRAVAGVDEAGRGCLAGPVVAAAVIPDPGPLDPRGRRLEAARAPRRAPARRRDPRRPPSALAVVAVAADVIDRINILEATRLAMREALARPRVRARTRRRRRDAAAAARPRRPAACRAGQGDAWSYAVACASIVAKVERDRMMVELDRDYPGTASPRHKGYGAPGPPRGARPLRPESACTA